MTAVKNPLPSQVLINALRDPRYRPYCLRCETFERMQSVGRLQWLCACGGACDLREELEALLRHPLPNGYSPKDATEVKPAATVLGSPASEGEAVEPMSASAEGVAEAVLNMVHELLYPRKAIVHLLRSWKASTTHPAPATVTEAKPQKFSARVDGWTTHDSPVELEYLPALDLLVIRIPASPLPSNGGPARMTIVKRRDLLAAVGGAR